MSAALFVDYIYLDTDERRRFAQVSHEYLITQLQFTGDESVSNNTYKVKLNFNHPCKELIWVVQKDVFTADPSSSDNATVQAARPCGKQWFNFTDAYDKTYLSTFGYNASAGDVVTPDSVGGLSYNAGLPGVAAGGANGVYLPVSFEGGKNPILLAKLQLNGHDRVAERDGKYFNIVQPYQHHENVPQCGINVYSFALKPEEHQPSGTCNMSRIDNASLSLKLTNETGAAKVRVYAINYNVLRIMSGMGGLAYSN